MSDAEMHVIKRNNKIEEISFDKILQRVKKLGNQFNLNIPYSTLVMKVIDQLYDNITTEQIDVLTAEQCAAMSTIHIDYSNLASSIIISNLHKKTDKSFYKTMKKAFEFKDINGKPSPLINKKFWNIVNKNKDILDNLIKHERDFYIDYFGFKTLERAYLLKINKIVIERPQYMWLRVAICLHGDNMQKVQETYDLMSQKYFTHATPTLFNAGTQREQLSSCYLICMEDDSIDGIYNTLKECAKISKWAGGIGLHIHNVRATGSHIRGTNGISNGIVPMLQVFNSTAKYVDQCILPETIVYTQNGPIEIQNLNYHDLVANNKGKFEKIEKILEHSYNGMLYNIHTMHSINPLKITAQHPILILTGQKKGLNYNLIEKRLQAYEKNHNLMEIFTNNAEQENELFQWCEPENLTIDDMLIYRIPSNENDKDDPNITADDCYLYGIILGDGSLQNNKSYGHITLNTYSKEYILNFCKNYFDYKYIEYDITIEDNTSRIRWNKNINLPIKYSDIYDNNKEKYLSTRWLNLPIEKSKYIIKGLIDTDGSKNKELVFDSTSYNLIESVRFILLKMGILTSGYQTDRRGEKHTSKNGIIENKKISYTLRIPKTEDICQLLDLRNESKFFKFFRYKDLLFTRIKSISTEKYNGTVYDLEFKNTHNYMIHNGIIHNGGGKRNGSIAIYLEPHHADIEQFLDMRKNHGDENLRARDLFYALWISDLFMERVHTNNKWSLFCPDSAPGLSDIYGEEFEKLYTKYEEQGLAIRTINARDLWIKILDSQMETGTPYMLYKDAINRKCNQNNLGIIKSSNLCCEITEYSDQNETAVCNLASIALPKFIKNTENYFEEVLLYTKNNCIYCKMLKNLLKKNNIKFKEIILTQDTFEVFKLESNLLTVPQLYNNGILIGGYNNCLELLRPQVDYEKLHEVAKTVTTNLNSVIDINYYPTDKTKRSNLLHRPIGIGIQGLADLFIELDLPFASPEAKEINKNIFETIYHGALERSYEISKERIEDIKFLQFEYKYENWTFNDDDSTCNSYDIYNISDASIGKAIDTDNKIETALHRVKPIRKEIESTNRNENLLGAYSSFEGSPISQGLFQFDLWGQQASDRYDWNKLRKNIKKYGIRNSLLVAPMPTASTSQILGYNECFEPYTSNIYSRRTLAGEFVLVNKKLMKELNDLDVWNEELKNNIIAEKGSIQNIKNIPQIIKEKYKIVWEIPMKDLIEMAKDRGAFICQSQSFNLWMENPNVKALTNMHFYAWKAGLKTGIYYLRRKAQHQAQQFTIEPEKKLVKVEAEEECTTCSA